MAARSWKLHLSTVITLALLVLLAGLIAGQVTLFIALFSLSYAAWLLHHVWRLHQWLGGRRRGIRTESSGIWREMFSKYSVLEQSNERQKRRFENMINDFRELTQSFPDAALVIDGADNIVWFNNAAQRLLELKSPADLGRPLTNLLRDPEFTDWLAVQGKINGPIEFQSPRAENQWLSANSVSVRDNQRMIVLRDITEVHNVEKIRRDFVANISHELRTPLTVLQGYLEMLENHDSSDVSTAVQKMLAQTLHMQSMLDDLLELSRLQSDTIDEAESMRVNMSAMLMQLKEQAEEISRGQHELVFDIDPKLHLKGVAADLESAIGNLIGNAIKFSPEGGPIYVSWKNSPVGPQLTVRDEGIGIPKRDIPRVTERFYRVGTDRGRSTGGTGLGLAIVKHVMNAHQATLSIVSELGEGSVFTCTFPTERAQGVNEAES
jgi:two-component system phosphate regulon sensor histidine kinase PhoR